MAVDSGVSGRARSKLVWVGLDSNGEVIRIFRNLKEAYGRIEERTKEEAVAELRWRVFLDADGECRRCGALISWKTMHMHERVYRGKGGIMSVDNCEALCSACHIGRDGEHGNRYWGGSRS